MRKYPHIGKLLSFLLLLAPGICIAAPNTAMNKMELTKLITGNTLVGSHLIKNHKFHMYMKKDGTHVEKRNGTILPGKWSVNPKGKLCWSYDIKDKTWCRWILNNGDGTYTKVKGKHKKVRQFKVVSGNSKNL